MVSFRSESWLDMTQAKKLKNVLKMLICFLFLSAGAIGPLIYMLSKFSNFALCVSIGLIAFVLMFLSAKL